MISARWTCFLLLVAIAFSGSNLARAAGSMDLGVQQRLIDTVSSYEFTAGDSLTPIFKELGYSPKSPSLWQLFPATRKLAAFYNAAEAAAPGDGARALAAVASKMSSRFDSLRNNTAVSKLISNQDVGRPLQFNMDVPTTFAAVPTEARNIIQTLSTYAEGGRLGGSYGILTKTFGLEARKAYSILADSDSVNEALMRGIAEVPSSQQNEKLKQFLAEAKAKYPALANASSVKAAEVALLGLIIDPSPTLDTDDLIECLCGGRPIGIMPRSQCHVGMPCR